MRRLMLPTRVILQKHPNRGTRTGETSPPVYFSRSVHGDGIRRIWAYLFTPTLRW